MSHLYRLLVTGPTVGHYITPGCWCIHHGSTHLRHTETQYTEDPHWAAARPSTDCSLLAACVYSGRVHCTVHCTLYTVHLYTVHLASSHLDLLTHGHTVPTLGSIVLSGPPVTSIVRGATQCIACSSCIFALKRGLKTQILLYKD